MIKWILFIFIIQAVSCTNNTQDPPVPVERNIDNSKENNNRVPSSSRRRRRSRNSPSRYSPSSGICNRDAVIQSAILSKLRLLNSGCSGVTTTHLESIENLELMNKDTDLESEDFSGLVELEELMLVNLDLQSIPSNVFSNLTSLTDLTLIGNDFSDGLPSEIFSSLTKLQYLDLSNNELEDLPSDIFSGLTQLQELYLEDNRFQDVSDFYSDLPSSLRVLDLRGNDDLDSSDKDDIRGMFPFVKF